MYAQDIKHVINYKTKWDHIFHQIQHSKVSKKIIINNNFIVNFF